jgi:hypothetical protein
VSDVEHTGEQRLVSADPAAGATYEHANLTVALARIVTGKSRRGPNVAVAPFRPDSISRWPRPRPRRSS